MQNEIMHDKLVFFLDTRREIYIRSHPDQTDAMLMPPLSLSHLQTILEGIISSTKELLLGFGQGKSRKGVKC